MTKVYKNQPLAQIASRTLAMMRQWMRPHGWFCLAFGVLALALLWRGLFTSELVVSGFGGDGSVHIYHTYSYAQDGFDNGELRTWNPYVFGGTPVVGSFQYTLLYPFRWLCAFLPMPASLNWMLFLHICLAGINMYAWAFFRCKSATGAFAAGVIFMLCGSLFARVPSGHFALVYAIAWIPLVFLGIDAWCLRRRFKWVTLAAFAASMQMYAGHPQYFYNTALMAGIYSMLILFGSEKKIKTAAGLLAIYPLAALIAAAELLPGYLVSQEAVRAGGVSIDWAATASMQFKDLLLILVPGFFGNHSNQTFWDNEHLHEMWVYSGIGGLLLACIGLSKIPPVNRLKFIFLIVLTLVFALGAYTPFFKVMRDCIPLYSSFRSMGRWTIYVSLFIALLAAIGVSKITSAEKIPRGVTWGFLGGGVVFLLAGLLLHGDSLKDLYHMLADKLTFKPEFRQNLNLPDREALAQARSASALCWSGGLAVTLGLVCLLARQYKIRTGLLLALTIIDLMVFASPLVLYFNKADVGYPGFRKVAKHFAADDRNLNLINKNSNITLKLEGIWGFDPIIFKRYVELIAASQGIPLQHASADIPVRRNSSVFKLLRGRYAFVPTTEGVKLFELQKDVLPRFHVAGDYKVMTDRDEILQALTAPDFDFHRNVILETDPKISPTAPLPKYKINILSSSAERWTIEVETTAPGILLMTDSYGKGWRANALPGSAQPDYCLQPANWAVRGIPMNTAGRHLIEIKYTPPGFALGVGVTLLTLTVLCMSAVMSAKFRKH